MKQKKTPLVIGLNDVRNGADYTLYDYFLFTVHTNSTPTWLLRRNSKVLAFISALLETPFDSSYKTVITLWHSTIENQEYTTKHNHHNFNARHSLPSSST